MLDRRQEILDRLAAILEPLAANFWRNRGELPEAKRPAITLLDADEIADQTSFGHAKRGLAASANLMKLTPQIILTLQDQKPDNASVGADLSALRAKVLFAICFDEGLQALVGNNGEIQYHGCETDLGRGRDFNGEMNVAFTFIYPFIPTELGA